MAQFTLPWENAVRIAFNLKDADSDAARAMIEECILEHKNIEAQVKNLQTEIDGRRDILAIGETPEDAVDNFALKQGWWESNKMNTILRGEDLEPTEDFTWAFCCKIGDIEHRVAGYNLDNYSLLTWLD